MTTTPDSSPQRADDPDVARRIVRLPSGTIEYEVRGPAESARPPVLFIHGAVLDSRLWAPVADALADLGYRCYLPTLPLGAHRIPWGADHERSPAAAADLVREFVAEFDLAEATLVGNDTGGGLCQLALDTDPHLVDRVVFTNCDAFEKFPPQPFGLVFALMRQRWLLRLLMGPMRITAVRHSPLGVGMLVTDPDRDLTRSILEPLRTDPAIRDDTAAFMRALADTDLSAVTPRLDKLSIPVSVVWGMADKAFTPALGHRLADVFAQATFTEVPGSRTFVSLDVPRAVVDAVVEITGRATTE